MEEEEEMKDDKPLVLGKKMISIPLKEEEIPLKEEERIKKGPKPYSPEWHRLAESLAMEFSPPIWPCPKCNYPVAEGFTLGKCQCPR